MNIVALQIPSFSGDLEANAKSLVQATLKAVVAHKADLCVTSAGFLTGLSPSFTFGLKGHDEKVLSALQEAAKALRLSAAVLVGARCEISVPPYHEEAVYLLYGGEVKRICTYTEGFGLLNLDGKELLICLQDGLERAIAKGFDAIQAMIHLESRPFVREAVYEHEAHRRVYAMMLACPCVSVNALGFASGRVYHGNSLVLDNFGVVRGRAPLYKEALFPIFCEFTEGEALIKAPCEPQQEDALELVWEALVFALKDMARTSGDPSFLIGLSGGIDSALVAALAVAAFGAEKVSGLIMPSKWSSEGSETDALLLAKNLGIEAHTVPISDLMHTVDTALPPLFAGKAPDLTEENVQARLRCLLLMAVANKNGYIVLNTGNKSELALGYCTLYGDMVGALGPIGDLYKGDVYALSAWYNAFMGKEIIPRAILEKAPSAELRPGQKDQDSLPPYEVIDTVLSALLEERTLPEHIVKKCAESGKRPEITEKDVQEILRLFTHNAFKHRLAAPCIQLTSCVLGKEAVLPDGFTYTM